MISSSCHTFEKCVMSHVDCVHQTLVSIEKYDALNQINSIIVVVLYFRISGS